MARSDGWDVPQIQEKTLDQSLRVRDGVIAYQQDTVALDKVVYSETNLAFIAMAAAVGRIDIVDIGGSLGTNFVQNRKVLQPFIRQRKCTWNVVERPATAEQGRRHFQDEHLRFFGSVDEVRDRYGELPASCLFTCSLQYMDEPFAVLEHIVDLGARLIAFDRLLVSPKAADEIFVQRPDPDRFFRATLPVRCFSRGRFIETMASMGFDLVEEFTRAPGAQFAPDGLIFTRREA